MISARRSVKAFSALVMAVCITGVAWSDEAPPQRSFDVRIGGNAVVFEPLVAGDSVVLTVVGPDGYYFSHEYRNGKLPAFTAYAPDGSLLPDGTYTYEALVIPREKKNRGKNDPQGLPAQARQPQPLSVPQSGVFTILNGSIVSGEIKESSESEGGVVSSSYAPPATGSGTSASGVTTMDQVILDDLIVDGSICVGLDCVNGESFGFDTLRLKENNLRIKFDDTSTSASFPKNDWQLTANDSSNGGAEKFSIEDITNSRVPFTIRATAPSNSFFINASGNIGLGTATPVVEIHNVDGDTPTLRLEQDGSSGFTPQTWDVAGNEAGFFVRDATNGSRLVLRIRPGAETSMLDIQADSKVYIGKAFGGTNNPTIKVLNDGGVEVGRVPTGETQGDPVLSIVWPETYFRANMNMSDGTRLRLTDGGDSAPALTFISDTNTGISRTAPDTLSIAAGGIGMITVTSTGVSINGSLSKSSGSFRIDHPLDPANKYLYHSFVESPDMLNIYNGNVVLDENGEAIVTMPEWFQALNQEFRYQLTPVGAPAPSIHVAEEIAGNLFRIAGGTPNTKVSWQVTGIRHDPYAEANRIEVEVNKPLAERGTFLFDGYLNDPEVVAAANAESDEPAAIIAAKNLEIEKLQIENRQLQDQLASILYRLTALEEKVDTKKPSLVRNDATKGDGR